MVLARRPYPQHFDTIILAVLYLASVVERISCDIIHKLNNLPFDKLRSRLMVLGGQRLPFVVFYSSLWRFKDDHFRAGDLS